VIASLIHWARVQPGRACVTWCPADGEIEVLTYGELDRRSGRLAAWLVTELDQGAAMALMPGNDIPSVVAIFAALRSGVPCLLLGPRDPVPRLRAILREHPVGKVLRSPFVGTRAAGLAEVIPADPETPGAGPARAVHAVPASRQAFMFGTSGSMAASKIVVQSHRALTSNAEAVRHHHSLDRETVLMGGLPIHHVNGMHFTLIAPVHAGAHVVLPQELSPFTYPGLVDTHRPHIASVVPPVFEALLITASSWRPPSSLRYFVSAAAPLTRSLITRVVAAYGVRVLQGYGLSETTNFSTTVPAKLSDAVYRVVALEAKIPSVGVALHGNDVEIIAPDGTVLGERQQGEICMRGHNVMDGYAGQPELTAEAFSGGWFHSDDLGYWAEGPDGRRYFYITGRSKNVANIRGETVALEEIERTLLSIDVVADAACVAMPHPRWGEQIIAFVALRGGDLAEVRANLAGLLPAVALPSGWRQLDAIPRTVTGKLRRRHLAEVAVAEGQM